MKSLLGCLALGILFFSCVEDETPDNPVELDGKLNITRVPDHRVGVDGFWVVVHDLDGIPIAHKRMELGETMTVELDDSKRYHLTTYAVDKFGDHRSEVLETYTNLPVAEDITLGLSPSPTPDPALAGKFQVDVLESEQPFAAYLTSSAGSYNSGANHFGTRLEMTMSRYEGIDDYLLVATTQTGETRYKMLKVTAPDTKLSYRFSDLSAFDKVFKFKKSDFSQFQFTSIALQKSETEFKYGYIVNSNRIGITFNFPMEEYELGFLTGIEHYFIGIEGQRSGNSDSYFSYQRRGAIPASINLPVEQTINIQSQTVGDFRLTKPTGITNWTAVWDQSDPFNGVYSILRWTAHGNEESVRLSLPEEIVALNPKMQNLSNFKLTSTEIITHSQSYDEQMREILVEIPKPLDMERTSIRQTFR